MVARWPQRRRQVHLSKTCGRNAHLRLPYIDADEFAKQRSGNGYVGYAYDAAHLAETARSARLCRLDELYQCGPCRSDLAVVRVGARVRAGGHPVQARRIRSRYADLPANVLACVAQVHRLAVVDNSGARRALVDIMRFDDGRLAWTAEPLPGWADALFAPFRAERNKPAAPMAAGVGARWNAHEKYLFSVYSAGVDCIVRLWREK